MKRAMIGLVLPALLSGVAQAGSLSGVVKQSTDGGVLPDARVRIQGSSLAAKSNRQGEFDFGDIEDGTYLVEISAGGHATQIIEINVTGEVKKDFMLVTSQTMSDAIIVTANRAQVRDSPVAFTNVTKEEIQAKYTTQDTPELLKAVPGVFARGSGLGESELFVRGMDAEHVQIMINNVPVNDPESQVVYWSNWTGLSGNAADIQVQRGVGTSLLGSGAFGGSVNIETDNFSAVPRVGAVGTMGFILRGDDIAAGNESVARNAIFAVDGSSGDVVNEKFNVYVRYERKAGDSYIEGTNYDGHSYYAGVQYQPNGKHTLVANAHGAPQSHNQAGNVQDPTLLESFGRTWNRRNHEYQENYYFKPVFELHHDWIINGGAMLTSTAFMTAGQGGGRYLRNDSLNMDTGDVEKINSGTFDADRDYTPSRIYNNSWQNDSQNDHTQFGVNTSYKHVLNDHFTYVTGGEARFWNADHYSESLNFEFGDEGVNRAAEVVDIAERRYDYTTDVQTFAAYLRAQVSPIPNKLSVVLDAQVTRISQNVSENEIQQYDYYNREFTDIWARQTQDIVTDWASTDTGATATVSDNPDALAELYSRDFLFFQPKVGANYNFNESLNAFANYSIAKKEPKVGDWYDRANVPLTAEEQGIVPETLQDVEVGFGLRNQNQSLTVNGYMMDFKDKIESVYDSNGDRFTMNAGNARHLGVELAYVLNINPISWKTSVSISQNKWTSTPDGIAEIFGFPVEDILGKFVPGAPQKIGYTEVAYNAENWSAFVAANVWDDYYVLYDNSTVEGLEEDGTLPMFAEVNAGFIYVKDIGDHSVNFRLLGNNLLGREQYVDASYNRDYGRGGDRYLGVTQSPLRTIFTTVGGSF